MTNPFEIPVDDEQLPDIALETAIEQLLAQGYAVRDFIEVLQERIEEAIEKDDGLDSYKTDRYHRLASALAVAHACATTLDI